MIGPIQDYLRVAARKGRVVEKVGSFLITITSHEANPYLNYAIPAQQAEPTAGDVAAMVAVFQHHQRKPRLEYVADLSPDVEPVLLAEGFVVETRTPLMVCGEGDLVPVDQPEGIEIQEPSTDQDLRGMLDAQSEAFGGGLTGDPDVARLRNSIAGGTIALAAFDSATGETVGGGVCTAPHQGFTEVAGIGVRERFRRRGIAAALTFRLTESAFHAGVTRPFLMAASENEARIYARAGYRLAGHVLHISRPGQPGGD